MRTKNIHGDMDEVFLRWKLFEVKLNIIYQDKTSSIKLKENGKESPGEKRGILTSGIFT